MQLLAGIYSATLGTTNTINHWEVVKGDKRCIKLKTSL